MASYRAAYLRLAPVRSAGERKLGMPWSMGKVSPEGETRELRPGPWESGSRVRGLRRRPRVAGRCGQESVCGSRRVMAKADSAIAPVRQAMGNTTCRGNNAAKKTPANIAPDTVAPEAILSLQKS